MRTIISILFLILFTPPVFAADLFLSDTEEEGSYLEEVRKTKNQAENNEQPKGALAEMPNAGQNYQPTSFQGSIEKLLNSAKPEQTQAEDWSEFESIEGTEAEAKFYQSDEYKIRSELAKPLERKSAVSNRLDDIENSLGTKSAATVSPIEDKLDDFYRPIK